MLSLSLLCQKDIVSVVTGQNIGRVDDLEFCLETARLENLVVFGRPKFFGLLGRGEDVKISWQDVLTVGSDVILINTKEIKDFQKRNKILFDTD